jgi:hypothetical protein
MQISISPPSRWWRRERVIQISYWPRWLAQLLCPHEEKNPYSWAMDGSNRISYNCVDCYKRIVETNTCAHTHIHVNAWIRSSANGEDIPKGWKCSSCGMPLSKVPEGSIVEPPLAWSAAVGHDPR